MHTGGQRPRKICEKLCASFRLREFDRALRGGGLTPPADFCGRSGFKWPGNSSVASPHSKTHAARLRLPRQLFESLHIAARCLCVLIGGYQISGCSMGDRASFKTVSKTSARSTVERPRLAQPKPHTPLGEPHQSTAMKSPPPAVSSPASSSAVLDSSMSLEDALDGIGCPEAIRQSQRLVDVSYYSFDQNCTRAKS